MPPPYESIGLVRASGPQPWLLAACRSGCAAGCCPEDAGSNPPPKGNTRRRRDSRRPAVPVTGGTVAGVLCSVPCFLCALLPTLLSGLGNDKSKNYEDETRHPSIGGTGGGGG